MKLTINKEFNALYNALSTFLIIANYQFFKEQAEEKWHTTLDADMENDIKELSKNPIFNDAKHYIDMELQTKDIFINPDFIRNSKDLDAYFTCMQNQNEEELRREIFKSLEFNDFIDYNDENSINLIIEQIDTMDFNSDIKWFLLSLIKKPKYHVEKFIKITKEYLPVYEQFKDKYMKRYQAFVTWIDEKIARHGINFIDDHLRFINLRENTEIHLYYSLFDLLSSYYFSDGSTHVFVGLMFRKYVEEQEDKNDIDKHLMVYKVLSDKSRYDIIKILINKESYGKEIAEELSISTATVSYHMDYLLGASLIILKRKSRRVYYSINKDQIKKSIDFLEKELNLQT